MTAPAYQKSFIGFDTAQPGSERHVLSIAHQNVVIATLYCGDAYVIRPTLGFQSMRTASGSKVQRVSTVEAAPRRTNGRNACTASTNRSMRARVTSGALSGAW